MLRVCADDPWPESAGFAAVSTQPDTALVTVTVRVVTLTVHVTHIVVTVLIPQCLCYSAFVTNLCTPYLPVFQADLFICVLLCVRFVEVLLLLGLHYHHIFWYINCNTLNQYFHAAVTPMHFLHTMLICVYCDLNKNVLVVIWNCDYSRVRPNSDCVYNWSETHNSLGSVTTSPY